MKKATRRQLDEQEEKNVEVKMSGNSAVRGPWGKGGSYVNTLPCLALPTRLALL
jgi:hypothetical protein